MSEIRFFKYQIKHLRKIFIHFLTLNVNFIYFELNKVRRVPVCVCGYPIPIDTQILTAINMWGLGKFLDKLFLKVTISPNDNCSISKN